MNRELFVFRCPVADGGYVWRNTREDLQPRARVRPFLQFVEGEERYYEPLRDETGLFNIFAETRASKEEIQAFANKYGWLGEDVMVIPKKAPGPVESGESIDVWVREIAAMREAVRLLESGKNPNRLQQLVNKGLEPPPPAEKHYSRGRVNARLLWDASRLKLRGYIVPRTLIGAMWFQLYQAIDGDKEYRRCKQCRKPYEVSPTERGEKRRYCSNACRMVAYRKRSTRRRKTK